MAGFYEHVNLDRKIGGNNTALILAAENGHFDVVKKLIDKNVDASIRNIQGETAEIVSERNEYEQITELSKLHSGPDWQSVQELELAVIRFRRDLDGHKSSKTFFAY